MSEPENTTPSIPAMGDEATGGAARKAGRPSNAQLKDENVRLAAELDQLRSQVATQEAGPLDPNPAPITPATADPAAALKGAANQKAIRTVMGQAKRLDADKYVAAHPDKRLMWINDMNGDVQRWIDAGAEPVPVQTRNSRHFEGITDRHESQWVRAVGGDDGMGNTYWVYLLMMSLERYDEVKLAPLRARQAAIKEALSRGSDQSDGAGGELAAYAPNLPTGGRGFQQIQDHLTGGAALPAERTDI